MTPTRLTAWLAGLFGIISLWLLLRLRDDVVISLWLLLRLGDADVIHDPAGAIFLVGLSLWTLLPYALLVAAARFGKFWTVTWGAPAVLFVVGLYGNLAYANEIFRFWGDADSVFTLIFLFMPFAQNIIATGLMAILLGVGVWIERRKQKGADCSAPSSDR